MSHLNYIYNMVYTLGESLLDIIITTPDDVVVRPGGAMLNTAVSLGRSNVEVALITELGDDDTARLITSFLESNNVVTDFVHLYNNINTSLALAFLNEAKKPKYTFIKNYPKNRELSKHQKFNDNDILLFGSLYSLDKEIRQYIVPIVNQVHKSNAIIIYDPNIRNAHHLEDSELMNAVYQNIKLSHIIKGSDEDFTNIFDTDNTKVQLDKIRELNNDALIIITLGADGVIADYKGRRIKLPTIETKVISTIGAGDAFNAGIIYAINNLIKKGYSLDEAFLSNIKDIITSGLHFSAKVCNSFDNYIPIKTNSSS